MKFVQNYGFDPSVDSAAKLHLYADNLDVLANPEVFLECFSYMDLTTLHTNDTVASVAKLVDKVSQLGKEFPAYPLPASVCTYPNFASVVRERRCSEELHVTTVAGCFPSSQSFTDVKVIECEMAVQNGADEVDIVLSVGDFLAGNEEAAFNEIRAIRKAVDMVGNQEGRKIILKVILETGLLLSSENIAEASFLAMEAGADFIKTSTGKVDVNATPAAAYIMCECIKRYAEKTGRKVGFKAAGGISDARDALCYYAIVKNILGKEWLNKDLFRLGVSRLGNSLMSAIEQKKVNFF